MFFLKSFFLAFVLLYTGIALAQVVVMPPSGFTVTCRFGSSCDYRDKFVGYTPTGVNTGTVVEITEEWRLDTHKTQEIEE